MQILKVSLENIENHEIGGDMEIVVLSCEATSNVSKLAL